MKPEVIVIDRPTASNPFPHAPLFRETPLPPAPPPSRKRKKLPQPGVHRAELLRAIREARNAVDEAQTLVGCMTRQVHELLPKAIGLAAVSNGEHIIVALQTMVTAAIVELKTARLKLNSAETLANYGSGGAPCSD